MVKPILQKNVIKKGDLDNKMCYVINHNDNFASCCVLFYIRVGTIHEKRNELGISHLIEHMLFKGTQRYQSFMDLNKQFDKLNCSVNAATSKNLTFIDMKLPYQNLEEGLMLLNEMVFKSLMLEEEINKEKRVIIEEFNRTNDDPQTKLEILTTKFNFEGHRLSNLILGTRKNVKGFTRQKIYKFYKKHYIPSNCCISIVGNTPKNIESKLNSIFKVKSNRKINHDIIKYENINRDGCLYKKFVGNLNHISLSFPIFSIMDNRKYYLDILIDILGGNMTSRLWIALREENQLVYAFNVFYECYEDGGFFSINFSCVDRNVLKTINKIIEILDRFKKIKISKDELELTKRKAIMDIEISSEESCGIGEFYGEQVILRQKLKKYSDIQKMYKECNEDLLFGLCKEIFVISNMKIVMLGRIEKNKFDKICKKVFSKN